MQSFEPTSTTPSQSRPETIMFKMWSPNAPNLEPRSDNRQFGYTCQMTNLKSPFCTCIVDTIPGISNSHHCYKTVKTNFVLWQCRVLKKQRPTFGCGHSSSLNFSKSLFERRHSRWTRKRSTRVKLPAIQHSAIAIDWMVARRLNTHRFTRRFE